MRINICGIEIDKYNFDEVVKSILKHLLSGSTPEYLVTPNTMHILTLQKDNYFQEIYRQAFLVVPDGVKMLGKLLRSLFFDRCLILCIKVIT